MARTTERTRENRLRRMAERQGVQLVKSRRRDPRATDYGRYYLSNRPGEWFDLNGVEGALTGD